MLLYHSQPTGNSYKVRFLLSLLGLSYKAVEVDIFGGGNRTAEFLSINPLGKVPALALEDGSILTESNAILIYLARNTALLPLERLLQAQVFQWMFFEQYSHLPYIGMARFYLHLLKKKPERDKLEYWHQRGAVALRIMNSHLTNRRWMVGEEFSLADIALYAYTHVAPEGGFDLDPYDAVRHWLERIEKVSGYIPLMQHPLDTVGRVSAC